MIIKQDIWYERANESRRLHIYVPDDYFITTKTYPVMYFFDGHNLYYDSDATYGKSWGLKEYLEQWDKEMIIVGMECSHTGNERLSEYFPYTVQKGFLSGVEGYGKDTFEWIVHIVKPYIDEHYRTMPFRECTAIAGSSMGGIMALYGAIVYNAWFSKAACLSSSIMPCMKQLKEDIRNTDLNDDTRIYLSWGTNEARGVKNSAVLDTTSYTYTCNRTIRNLLRYKGCQSQMYCQVEGRHCEADWEKQVPLFMGFLWQERDVANIE